MTRFSYKVKDASGKTVTGAINALDTRAVFTTLRDQGLFVVDIRTSLPQAVLSLFSNRFQRSIGISELANFTRQLSIMITSGLTITESLTTLRVQAGSKRLERLISDLLVQIEGGVTFARALSRHTEIFPTIYIEVIRAGEASGLLDKMLTRLADTLEQERELRGKLLGALLYPLILIIGMGVVITIIMIFVVPQLTSLYKDFGSDLPLLTRIIVAISNFFVNFWFILVFLIVGGLIAFASWRKTETGRYILDSFLLKLPILGEIQRSANVVELTRTLGMLLSSGMPIVNAINSVGRTARNVRIGAAMYEVAKRVEKGLPLGNAFAQEGSLPPLIAQMARIGEQTGKIDEVMVKTSRFFEAELEQRIKAFTTLLQPIILVVLGVVVGFLMVAIIMPIYGLLQKL